MNLDDLRSILLPERETGRLTIVAPDIFEKAHAEIGALIRKVYAFDDPFSDEARSLIDETNSIKETIHDIFAIRSRKILALTIMHAEGNYYDREEVKRMIPAEKEMFEGITSSIEQCKGILLLNVPVAHSPQVPRAVSEEEYGIGEPWMGEGEIDGISPAVPAELQTPRAPANPLSPPCVLVHALEDMESFMGVDGRVYTLSKGDIVTLPERNAAVLSERNIVLNINLCK